MAHQLRVLGSPEVVDGDGKQLPLALGKPLALLVFVALHSSPVTRDDLADLLWPEADRKKGRHSVRQALWVLRNAFEEDLFESHDPLVLKAGAMVTDLSRFSEALAAGRVEEARSLWRGPVLENFLLAGVRNWNQWTEELRTEVELRFYRALLQHAESLKAQGNADEAVSALDQAVTVAPLAEAPHVARIELLLDLLRPDAAREAIADALTNLGDHLDSAGHLVALEERLDRVIQEQRSRVGTGEGFPMEFVGRSGQLAGLHSLWREVLQGRTRVTVITGPSGIGKTRLAQELLSYVAGEEVRSVAVKGTRAETKLRWGAASDFVRQLLRLPGSAGISPASDGLLRAMLPSMGRNSIDLQSVNGVSPAAMIDAVSDLLESVTFEAPLVALIDDFQWLDPESRTLFMGLANRSREIRVILLILGRSELASRHWEEVETALVAEAGARRFLLGPLLEEEVGELLALGAAFQSPEEAGRIVAKVFQASAGNPLFIREILKELHEKGILRREEPGWVFDTSEIPEELELPENIRLLLGERLNRLSEPAASLAAILAGKGGRSSSETLQKDTQLPPKVFTQAVAELLERGVIDWVDGTSLDFVHDALRDAAATHLAGSVPGPPPRGSLFSRNRGAFALAVGVFLALPTGILWGRGAIRWGAEPDPPPYGGGTLIFQQGENPPRALRILKGPMEEVERAQLDPPAPAGTRLTFRDPGGGYLWFGADDPEEGPDLVRILHDGTRIPFFPGPGDESLLDISPEGTRVLFTSENVGKERFSHSLYWADLGPNPSKHLIFEGVGPLSLGRWSPDGQTVAFSLTAASDSLAFYSLAGERIWAHAFGEIYALDWCGGSLLLSAAPEGIPYLFKVDLASEEVTALAALSLGRGLTCSPDGTAAVLVDVIDRRPAFILRNLHTGEVFPFPAIDVQDAAPYWMPDAVTPVPVRVRADEDTVRMEWAETRSLAAYALYRDGTRSSEAIWWESLDPDIANFNPHQQLTGNQAGVARVLARSGLSLRDTVVVIVADRGTEGTTALLRERWERLDTALWTAFGSHPPVVRDFGGERVLQLLGDEKYSDGVIYKGPVPLNQGLTVELEFKMRVDRDVHQNLGLCLSDSDPRDLHLESGAIPGTGEVLCARYPAREFEKMDLSELYLQITPGVESRVRVPEALPTTGWTHLAIQVRADGECSLVVNRERVATSPILLPITPMNRWTVIVEGDAVETEVFIRDLNIWREVRY